MKSFKTLLTIVAIASGLAMSLSSNTALASGGRPPYHDHHDHWGPPHHDYHRHR